MSTPSPAASAAPAAQDWLAEPADTWVELANQQGTPYYLFDADAVRHRVQAVRAASGGQVQVYYAVKANPNLGLLRALQGGVDGLDISSGGELQQALLAGYAAAAMSFAGPAKTDAEIEAAVAAGVGAISAESVREIDACAAAALRLGRPAQLLLRVNPELSTKPYGLKMGGRAVQFGIDEAELPAALDRIRAHGSSVDWVGLHAYVGSQCFDPAAIVDTARHTLRLAAQLQQACGWPCRKLNLGGGFGVGQSGERRQLDLAALSALLVPMLQDERTALPQAQLFFELGRFLLADAGLYVVQVVDRKTSRGKTFITCDGGLNHHLAAAGTFGAALRGNFPVLNLSRPEAVPGVCQVAGPSCNPTDLLGQELTLPEPQIGDLLGVAMSGAYGLSASPLMFLGRETPTEWVRTGGACTIGRRKHPITDFN